MIILQFRKVQTYFCTSRDFNQVIPLIFASPCTIDSAVYCIVW